MGNRRRALAQVALPAAELLLIAAWALLITRPYLNLDPLVIPAGREFASAIASHQLWMLFRADASAALWNGNLRGGAPAFADPYGSMLHPLVALATLLLAVSNGAKIALVGAFAMGGLAQWWLARVLGLGLVARLWSPGMGVAGGHLAARMEIGVFSIVLSTAASALVLPPLVSLCRTRSRRAAVLLGLTLALALLAGQGYLQIGLAFTLPAVLLLFPWERSALATLLRRLALAGGLAALLAAPFLVPLLHFLPEFGKDGDRLFRSAQPLAYVPLNLVIGDHAFYGTTALGKLPYPFLYENFVGWLPLLLVLPAIAGWHRVPPGRVVLYLGAVALSAFWVASAAPLAWLVATVPGSGLAELAAGVRFPSLIAGLAVPPLLALAAAGLDGLLRADWPCLRLSLASPQRGNLAVRLDLRWLLLIPLAVALLDARTFGTAWITTTRLGDDVPTVLQTLRTPDLQWVNPPFGEHFWLLPAADYGLKLSQGVRPWQWKGRPDPEPVLRAERQGAPPGMTLKTRVAGVAVYAAAPGRVLAAVVHADGTRTVCTAQGQGGYIDVTCDAPEAGRLVVKENSWSGWQASVDGQPVGLAPERWLAVDLPAERHTVQSRYRPWDVPLGILLSLLGLGVAAQQWRQGG